MRYAFIGDVGGHREPFEELLEDLGCDVARGTIPAGLTVVQVGDLIHRGPDSHGVVRLVERFIEQPGWVQLAGNHEAQHLRPLGPAFAWPPTDEPPARDIQLLQQWWEAGLLRVAFGAQTASGRGILATHAGLTVGIASQLGIDAAPATDAAAVLNALPHDDASLVWRAGMMLGYPPLTDAGPLWAQAGAEVAAGWHQAGVTPSFDQVVGHSMLYDWFDDTWNLPWDLEPHAQVFPERRHAVVDVAGQEIWAIDPTHLAQPAPVWKAMIVAG